MPEGWIIPCPRGYCDVQQPDKRHTHSPPAVPPALAGAAPSSDKSKCRSRSVQLDPSALNDECRTPHPRAIKWRTDIWKKGEYLQATAHREPADEEKNGILIR